MSAPSPLVSPRLTVRAFRAADASELLQLYQSNRERLSDSFPNSVASLRDEDSARSYIHGKAIDWEAAAGFWYGIFSPFNPGQPTLPRPVQNNIIHSQLPRTMY